MGLQMNNSSGLDLEHKPTRGSKRVAYSLDPYVEVSHRPTVAGNRAVVQANETRNTKALYSIVSGVAVWTVAGLLGASIAVCGGAGLAVAAFLWFCTELS